MMLNDLIYAGAKFVCEKNGVYLKTMDRKMRTQTKITDNKSTTISKNTKTEH